MTNGIKSRILAWSRGHVGGIVRDNPLFVEAVVYRYRAGIPWRDLPERFGDWKIVYQRFNRWAEERRFRAHVSGFWRAHHDNEYMMIDATIVRAHQHSAGAENGEQAIGRNRAAD